MAPSGLATQEQPLARGARQRVVNDFTIQVATVNGSGSQTANLVLIRSIFQMGIPVSGKNMFPSNIAGLPTWYTIRASAKGYIGRKKEVDFLVALNPETARGDVLTLSPGAAAVYDEPLKLRDLRSDLVFYPVPFDKIIGTITHDAKLRRLVRNMIYDGVLSRLLSIDMGQMEKALRKQLGRKQKALEMNMSALRRVSRTSERIAALRRRRRGRRGRFSAALPAAFDRDGAVACVLIQTPARRRPPRPRRRGNARPASRPDRESCSAAASRSPGCPGAAPLRR